MRSAERCCPNPDSTRSDIANVCRHPNAGWGLSRGAAGYAARNILCGSARIRSMPPLTHSGSKAESEATPERRLSTAELFREVPEFIDRFDVPVLRADLPDPFRVRRRKARDLMSSTRDPVQLHCIRCFAARPFPERDPRSVSFISMRQGPPRLAGAAVLLTPEFHRFRN